MSPFIDDYWLLTVLSFVSITLVLAIELTGLVLALRYWRMAGVSARLAAAGFGLSIVATVGSAVLPLLWELLNPYVLAPYPAQESPIAPHLIFHSVSVLGSLISTTLIVAALWTAWRRADHAP